MKYNILTIPPFDKQLKHLAKKYISIKADMQRLAESLSENPTQGTLLTENCYKIRMTISSKGKGKSGGARVITHFYIEGATVYLLAIYDKSEQSTISDNELRYLLRQINK